MQSYVISVEFPISDVFGADKGKLQHEKRDICSDQELEEFCFKAALIWKRGA